MSTSTITPISMSLTGQYASSFQQILDKAVQTAEVPLTQLQNQDSIVLGKKTDLTSLNSSVSSLTDSLNSLATLAASQGLGATSSDPSAVTVTNTGATSAGTFTINSVTSTATAATERSLTSYGSTDPVSSTGSMQLVVGSQTYNFTLSSNTLTGLENQINSLNAGVTASILTTPTGNYLSLQANQTGATTLQLIDDPSGANKNILTNTDQGSNAVFQLNGIDISQSSNTVNNIIPGLSFSIAGASSSPVTLTVAPDPSQLTSALQDFVNQYNGLETAVQGQTGSGGGSLTGDTVIEQLQASMRQLTTYFDASGSVHDLSDLGITLSDTGQMSFDPSVINSMSSTQLADAYNFVGSTTSGIGSFSNTFDEYSNPIDGMIQTEISGLNTTDTNLQDQMSTLTDRINSMQQSLATQIEAADALESNYETQQTQLQAELQGLDLVLYGKQPGSPGS